MNDPKDPAGQELSEAEQAFLKLQMRPREYAKWAEGVRRAWSLRHGATAVKA